MSSSSIKELPGQCKDLFTQDEVLLRICMGRLVKEHLTGTLRIVQNPDTTKCIEWRPKDLITFTSDTQDQELAEVNLIGSRQHTLSDNMNSDFATACASIIRIPIEDLKTFRVSRENHTLQLTTQPGIWQTCFFFRQANADVFVAYLHNHIKTTMPGNDIKTYVVVETNTEGLDKLQ